MAKIAKKSRKSLGTRMNQFRKPPKKHKPQPEPAPKPRQARIPGMEDSPIKDVEDAAIEHSEIRTEVVAARARLHDSELSVVSLMKANGKKSYNHNGIRIRLREAHDAASVQVKRHDREDGK